jgi:hypothetical protein
MLQGIALAAATGRLAANAAADAGWAAFELCQHNRAADDNSFAPGGGPESSDAHCIFCLAGVSYALEAPLTSVAFHIIIIAIAPVDFHGMASCRHSQLTPCTTSWPAARRLTLCGRELAISASIEFAWQPRAASLVAPVAVDTCSCTYQERNIRSARVIIRRSSRVTISSVEMLAQPIL